MPTHSRGDPAATLPLATLVGRVEGGVGNAQHWLTRFNAAYRRKLGRAVFPGSLNLRLAEPFDWTDGRFAMHVISFARTEYGGDRDILLLPCRIVTLDNHGAHLWTTTTPRPLAEWQVIELLADVSLRETYALRDGQELTVEILGSP